MDCKLDKHVNWIAKIWQCTAVAALLKRNKRFPATSKFEWRLGERSPRKRECALKALALIFGGTLDASRAPSVSSLGDTSTPSLDAPHGVQLMVAEHLLEVNDSMPLGGSFATKIACPSVGEDEDCQMCGLPGVVEVYKAFVCSQ